MKKLTCFIIALAFVCSLGVPVAAATNNTPSQMIQRNEFIFYVYGDDEISARSASNLSSVSQKRSEYIDEIKKVAQNPVDAIREMGYSQEMAQIILQMKQNPQYTPTDTELSRAAATVTMAVSRAQSIHIGNKTYCTLAWSYSWSSRPLFLSKDIVAIAWNNDFIVTSASVNANIQYASEHNSSIKRNVDMSDEMKSNVSANNNTISLSFPMRVETTPQYNYWWAKDGSGSFEVTCLDHHHAMIGVSWAYGHSTVQVGDISITLGFPSISFGSGTSTAAADYNNIMILDDL